MGVTPVGAADINELSGRPGGAEHRATNTHRGGAGFGFRRLLYLRFVTPCFFYPLKLVLELAAEVNHLRGSDPFRRVQSISRTEVRYLGRSLVAVGLSVPTSRRTLVPPKRGPTRCREARFGPVPYLSQRSAEAPGVR